MKHYTLSRADIGQASIPAFGKLWMVNEFIGRILPGDVGKRVYLRGGILQVENDAQRTARLTYNPNQFDTNVAWLQFMGDRHAREASGPTTSQSQRELRLMRIAFDWAMKYPHGQSAPLAKTDHVCQALHNHNPADYDATLAAPCCGCPTGCGLPAVMHLFRVTAYVHENPMHENVATVFCEPCGDDALESGQFCVGEDLLEPACDSRCREYPMTPCPIHKGGQS